jgi:RNA polymerase sigma-70 factor (ECF subfamily)
MDHAPEVEDLWRDLHDRLLAYVRRRVATKEDAEDVVQDVFLRIHASRGRLGGVRNVTAWIYRVAANAITDYYRSRAKAIGAVSRLADEPAAPDQGLRNDESRLREELAGCLEPLLNRLPDHYGEAVRLTELGGLTQKEAAGRAGISVSGMKARVQRGRGKLKDLLLDCCEVELDGRRGVVDYEPRSGGDSCDCECS